MVVIGAGYTRAIWSNAERNKMRYGKGKAQGARMPRADKWKAQNALPKAKTAEKSGLMPDAETFGEGKGWQ